MNTQQLVKELLESGLTQQQLADLVLCSQPAISAFANGSRGIRPSLSIGSRLAQLHRERCAPGMPADVDGIAAVASAHPITGKEVIHE